MLIAGTASAEGLPPAPTWITQPGGTVSPPPLGQRVQTAPAPSATPPHAPEVKKVAPAAAVAPEVKKVAPAAAVAPPAKPMVSKISPGGILITNLGAAQSRYPLQFGQVFEPGRIPSFPQVQVNGEAIPTQADVKLRHPDGSVKHAILSVLLPSLPANGSLTLAFINQVSGNNIPLDVAGMLDTAFDFDAVLEVSNPTLSPGRETQISARSMLREAKTCVDDVTKNPTALCAYWTKGSIATTVILADHSPRRSYDFGLTTDDLRPVRPIFHVTFWPGINKVRVRFIGENSNPKAMQTDFYNVSLKVGTKAQQVFTKPDFVHHYGTRWTKAFWIGEAPDPKVNVRYDLASLTATRMVAHYAPNRVIDAEVDAQWSAWQKVHKDLGDSAFWTTYMGTAGGRGEIGDNPVWMVRWLYSGDWRAREIALTLADLAGNWPMQVRESATDKTLDKSQTVSGLGRTVTAYGRPTLWLFDSRQPRPSSADAIHIQPPPGFSRLESISGKEITSPGRNQRFPPNDQKWAAVAEQFRFPDPRYARYADAYFDGWVADGAHQPNPFYLPYLLSGEYWYLEELQLWAGAQSLRYCPGSEPWCRGPGAGIQDEVRGMGWVFRNRVNAAVATPDGAPEKAVFTTMINDALALWEGQRDLPTPNADSPMWRFGHDIAATGTRSPLHFWLSDPDKTEGLVRSAGADTIAVGGGLAPWMQNFLILELGRAEEMGFATRPLFSWVGSNLIGQLTAPDFNPYLSQSYRMPVTKAGGGYFRTWAEVRQGYPMGLPGQLNTQTGRVLDTDFTYAGIARAAAALTVTLPDGASAWDSINAIMAPKVDRIGLEWAIIPRPPATR